jgi:16S rRNA (guanine527-N7)-methyltransferase
LTTHSNIQTKLQQLLTEGLAQLHLNIPQHAQEKILTYLQLLEKWNQVYNLTAVRDPIQMMTRHILDSLTVVPYLQGQNIIDVGTGAGLPGIPLALALPECRFVLLDSNGKKMRFLIQAKAELGLANVEVVQARVEDYHPKQCFDEVISRAFTQLDDMIEKTRHLCCPKGRILAMKGMHPEAELNDLDATVVVTVFPLTVPGLQEQRHLVSMGFVSE